jgi:hypothetical protein
LQLTTGIKQEEEWMPAYYAFDYQGTFRDGLIKPPNAINFVQRLKKTNLSDFFNLGAVSVKLVGDNSGAIFLSGENSELKSSLKRQTIKAIEGDEGLFVAKYVRFRMGAFDPPQSLICIASISKWWRGTSVADCGTADSWQTLYNHEFIALSLSALGKMVKNAK